METRFMKLLGEIIDLDKEFTQKDINLKILRGLPEKWKMMAISIRNHLDVNCTPIDKLFIDLVAYEFEHQSRRETSELRSAVLVADQQPSTSSR
nr:kinesin-related protein 4-like [Ipomoea batatas]GMD52386.1 kinesin-related protein 4-like [Ipomoea batatas]